MSKEFEISNLLAITSQKKYEATVAAFEVVNNLSRLTIPKKELNRKPAVQAMLSLASNAIQYDYIDDETRQSLEEELQNRARQQNESALNAVFSTPDGQAPVVDESDEELDEIGETAPPEVFSGDEDNSNGMDDEPEVDSFEDVDEGEDSDDNDDSEEEPLEEE